MPDRITMPELTRPQRDVCFRCGVIRIYIVLIVFIVRQAEDENKKVFSPRTSSTIELVESAKRRKKVARKNVKSRNLHTRCLLNVIHSTTLRFIVETCNFIVFEFQFRFANLNGSVKNGTIISFK